MKEHLSAPGEMTQWFDGSIYALKKGDFTKIRVHHNGSQITAHYGADEICIDLSVKETGRIFLRLESTSGEVLQWFKACVTDVMLHPQAGFDEGLNNAAPQAAPFGTDGTFDPYTDPDADQAADFDDAVPDPQVSPADEGQYGDDGFAEAVPAYEEAPQTLQEKWERLKCRPWFAWLMLVVLPPFGIYLLWHVPHFEKVRRVLLTALFAAYFLFIWLGFLGVNTGVNRRSISAWWQRRHQTETVVQKTPSSTSKSSADSEDKDTVIDTLWHSITEMFSNVTS
jgi:hypothetical protein